MSNLKILGQKNDTTTVDGILIGDSVGNNPSNNVSHVRFEHLYVYGFRDGWFYGDNTWCVMQDHIITLGANRYCVNLDGQNNAGENYEFSNCTFANANNGTTSTGIGVYTNAAGNNDVNIVNCSFDYNDIQIDHNGGAMSITNCHIENNHMTNAAIRVYATTRIGFGLNPAFIQVDQDWTPVTYSTIVPQGVYFCLVDFQTNNLPAGSHIYFDDVTMHLLWRSCT